jgi:hypothetical protein
MPARLEVTSAVGERRDRIAQVLEHEPEADRVDGARLEQLLVQMAVQRRNPSPARNRDGVGVRLDAFSDPAERLHLGQELALPAADVQDARRPLSWPS